jgi:NTP pyrophosphatase (non-canonical NTP hydrolase)
MLNTEQWKTVHDLVAWLDDANGRTPQEVALRILKVTEEAGEVASAYVGMTGQNPRKGVTHSRADVANELCDVILAAAVALASVTDEDPQLVLDAKLLKVAKRAEAAVWRDLHEASDAVWNRPAADRTDLRDRIAQALATDDGHPWDTLCTDTQQSYLDNADAAMAAVNAEQSEYEETVVGRLNELNTELARTNGRLTARVAELEQVPAGRATALTDAERKILSYAIDLVADQMATRGDEFMPDDEHALAKLSRLADEAEAAS